MRLKPKKNLGQNFLVDQNIQRKIIAACAFRPSDTVLEIGAGRGDLTRLIAEKAAKVYALEIDSHFCLLLREALWNYPGVSVIRQDILKFDFKKHLRPVKSKVKVFGNIPYYITTPIIERLITFRNKIEAVYLTVQKEFARRIVAVPGSKEYGSFSCFVQYYAQPKILFAIKKTSFYPSPKVDSCFLKLEIKPKAMLGKEKEGMLFKIIRAAFCQRRKTLRNSLKGVISRQRLEIFFQKYNLDPNIRPEDLGLQEFINLVRL
jgi:16S rRNA (adenine1518-N6/adenine1519-N6)-dimethyltransferase